MDIDKAKASPEAFFGSPSGLLANTELSKDDKITILESWQQEVLQLTVAEEENMPQLNNPAADHEKLLNEINQMLIQLKEGN